MHVHVSVEDITNSIGFYSALFAAPPAVVKPDYAKWMLDDPRVNFAISTRGRQPGLDHLGIQVESQDELQEVYARLRDAGGDIIDQGQTPVAMRSRKNRGSTIRRASRGKLFSPRGKTQTTAIGAESAGRAWRMKSHAASQRSRRRDLLPPAARRRALKDDRSELIR